MAKPVYSGLSILLPSRHLLYAGLLLAVATAAAATPNAESTAQPVLTVTTVTTRTVTWPVTVVATGGLYAWQDLIIAAQTGGLQIVDILADVGQTVQKGQVLARLEQDTVEAALAQRRAETAQAQAALAQASSDATRARRAKGALSEQQAEQYFIAQDRAKAALDAAKAAQHNQEIQLSQTRVIAIDDGIIASRSAILGAVVMAGSELFRLVRQGRIEWRAEVTAQQLAQIHAQQLVHIQLPSGQRLTGKVRLLGPTLDPKTRKALVYVDLPTDSPARAGMFVRGEFILEHTSAVILPISAIVLRDGFSYLFTVKPDNTVQQRKISTGRLQGNDIELLTELEPEAAVISSGGAFLEDGDKVQIVPAQVGAMP